MLLPIDMIVDTEPVTNHFVSMPNHLGQLNCAAYLAGIVEGILDSAKFASTSASLFPILVYIHHRR